MNIINYGKAHLPANVFVAVVSLFVRFCPLHNMWLCQWSWYFFFFHSQKNAHAFKRKLQWRACYKPSHFTLESVFSDKYFTLAFELLQQLLPLDFSYIFVCVVSSYKNESLFSQFVRDVWFVRYGLNLLSILLKRISHW